MAYQITTFENTAHRVPVISLWEETFGYEAPHNGPGLAIDKKRNMDDGLFFVAVNQDEVIGTVMAGNQAVQAFYRSNGYKTQKRISMGKRLGVTITTATP